EPSGRAALAHARCLPLLRVFAPSWFNPCLQWRNILLWRERAERAGAEDAAPASGRLAGERRRRKDGRPPRSTEPPMESASAAAHGAATEPARSAAASAAVPDPAPDAAAARALGPRLVREAIDPLK